MRKLKLIFISLIFIIGSILVQAQQNRIDYNGQKLFLSGSNLAWVSFAADVNSNNSKNNANTIANWMLQMHDNGGNSMRWWLHTDGTTSPVFGSNNVVTGPGATTIADIKRILDLAWEREIGLDLCLWSFDMLNRSKSSAVIARNTLLLTDTSYTNAYIKNCLKPMVDALKGHPGILTWEVFNEPEGMSTELGWSQTYHVPMAVIQRFVNLCASAIHEVDPAAKVTNGTWAFAALTDVLAKKTADSELNINNMTQSEKKSLEDFIYQKYGFQLTADEIVKQFQKLTAANKNYYSDNQLIAAGGKANGTLDFYSVHYYTGLGASNSPFTHSASFWGLNKPIVVGEFACSSVNDNIPKDLLYRYLYTNSYAGALAWSWTDSGISTTTDMLASMKSMWDSYKSDVDVLGVGEIPTVSITSPTNGSSFNEGSQIKIEATANDKDGSVSLVEFFVSDTVKIGETTTTPYSCNWTPSVSSIYRLTAVATDNQNNKNTSAVVSISVGQTAMTKFEAETASLQGGNMTVKNDPAASDGRFVDIATQDSNFVIVWQVMNVQAAGSYEIAFGYKLAYNTPKSQYINVNGVRATELVFDGNVNVWLEKKLTVNLVQGTNTIQMKLSWGWMYLDYLAVPTSIITDIKEDANQIPTTFTLEQNYPNPFNPSTNISYQLPVNSLVVLKVYDLLGREVATLVNETQTAGIHHSTFNSLNYSLSSGVYFYTLKAGDFVESKKMILLK